MTDLAEWFKWPPGTKYEGQKIDTTPDSYLKWVIRNWEEEDVVIACEEEIEWRDNNREHIDE